jgi:hypothetical protein
MPCNSKHTESVGILRNEKVVTLKTGLEAHENMFASHCATTRQHVQDITSDLHNSEQKAKGSESFC